MIRKSLFTSISKSFRVLFPALVLSVALTVSALALGSDDVPELPAPDGSSYTPEIIVPMIDKKEMKLSSLRGKVVMLDFFLTTCPHCQDHAPHVAELYNKYRGRGFVVLGLAQDFQATGDLKAATAAVQDFMKKYKLTYPVGFTNIELLAYFTDSHNRGVPQMVLFGPDGRMTLRRIGWNDEVGKEFDAAVAVQLDKLGPAAATPPQQQAPAQAPAVKPGSRAVTKSKSKRVAHA
jgi:thiol-disulfide isomerase/thioredoxin